MHRALIFLLFCKVGCIAATYYVATTGNDLNDGSQGSPWLTISHATTNSTAGDTIRVQAGTYNEVVPITVSGAIGAWINWVADGQAICRGFTLTGVSYVRVIGFEVTHANASFGDAFKLFGTCDHVEILDNYIHNVKGNGVIAGSVDAFPSYITVRGNTFYWLGRVAGVYTNKSVVAVGSCYISPHHWLVEYNTMQRIPEAYFTVFGTNVIERNNACSDSHVEYWAETAESLHVDIVQEGSDGAVVAVRNRIYERNLMGDCPDANSHAFLLQDDQVAGDTNVVLRGNILYNFGNGAIGVLSMKRVQTYNNTIHAITNGPALNWFKKGASSDYPDGAIGANTLLSAVDANGSGSIYVESGTSGATVTNNLGYQSPAHSSFVSTSDPKFLNTAALDFHVQSDSPARSSGTNLIWITSADNSGTSFTVNDPFVFTDGWDMVDGDTVTVGKGGTTTRINGINLGTSTITVADSVTWTNGMPVYWGTDTAPDIGALPYGSTNLTSATIYQSGTTYTVTTTGDCRGVWFYVNGIPTTWDSSSPYSATIASGTVTAKAYALYAQTNPVVTAAYGPSVTITNLTIGTLTILGP